MALDAASYGVLWAIYDQTGVRPEHLLPTLWIESGLNPALPNTGGAAFYGINQISGSWIQNNLHVTPQEYLQWPASQQLARAVLPFLKGLPKPLPSGTRVYQANFLPATINGIAGWQAARYPDDVVVSSPSAGKANPNADDYQGNKGLDIGGKGWISVGDIEAFVGKAASHLASEFAKTYAVRPNETMQDPVLGTDPYLKGQPPAPTPPSPIAEKGGGFVTAITGGLVIVGAAGLLAWGLTTERRR
jgi:hypothetical protein